MATTTRADDRVRVTVPDSFVVGETPPAGDRPAASRDRRRSRGPAGLPDASDAGQADLDAALLAALSSQEMHLVDTIPIEPIPGAPQRLGRARRADRTFTIDVDVAPHEDAVLLLEQDGMYSWVFQSKAKTTTRRRSRGAPSVPDQRRVSFSVELEPSARTTSAAGAQRGLISDFVVGRVTAYLLKFAARLAVSGAITFLERNVRSGFVRITSPDVTDWTPLTDLRDLTLPEDREPRVLLLIHGTFSSTIGGFHGLSLTPWGRAFLEDATATYDAVLGFDHRTLSQSPIDNATDLLRALQSIEWELPPQIDVITHSRGGLVIRSLLEFLLPLTPLNVHFGRVVFVAATNGGTTLARPENWHQLIDLYTNLAAASFKVISLLPQAAPAALALNEVIQGLGVFVKYAATKAADDDVAPGLAAMDPNGAFIKRLNQLQAGQLSIDASYYCVVSSEFEARLDGAHEPSELPKRLLIWARDHVVDARMDEANDLVVNVASMGEIDPTAGDYVKDTHAFGRNPSVYHSTYFLQPGTVEAFTRWLERPAPPAERGLNDPPVLRLRDSDGGRRTAQPQVDRDLPAAVTTDFILHAATTGLDNAQAQINPL
jgi:hypothetical protein